ncbi:MAG TPA: hypothetical protein VF213_10095, partial [Dongiaceae bacterium]
MAAVGNASFLNGIEVKALDHVTSAHSANGFANLVVHGAGVHVVGNVTEIATVHTHHSMNYITAVALGTLDATRGAVEVDGGDVDVIASAIGTRNVPGGAFAVASLDVLAGSAAGRIAIDGQVDVWANAVDPGYPYHAGTFGTVYNQGLALAAANAVIEAGNSAHGGGSIAIGGNIDVHALLRSNGLTFGSISNANRALGHGEFATLGTEYLTQTAAAQLEIITGNGDIALNGASVTARNTLVASGPPVVGRGPYGSTDVGGANADVTIDAAGGAVHQGALAVTAVATGPHVQFSSNARFEGDAVVNVTSAGAAASPPVAVAVAATDPPIAPVGSVAVVPPEPAPPAVAPPATDPPSAPVGDAPVVPPRPPPPLAGWQHADAVTWFSALLHSHGGSLRGALAAARPMSLR